MKLLERNYLIIKTQNNVKAIFLPESHLTSGDENDLDTNLAYSYWHECLNDTNYETWGLLHSIK